MQVNSINKINFQAKIVQKVPILAKNEQNDYKNFSADLLEYDINAPEDMKKIEQISKLPGFALYGYEIYQSLVHKNSDIMTKHCFALVNNSDESESGLNNDNVLGLFTFREMKEEGKPDEIALFITNQQYRTRWYKEIRENKFYHNGKGMAQALKVIFSQKSIKCYSERGAVEFWKKNGFKEIAEQKLILKR